MKTLDLGCTVNIRHLFDGDIQDDYAECCANCFYRKKQLDICKNLNNLIMSSLADAKWLIKEAVNENN